MADKVLDDALGQRGRKVQPHLRQLHADVGVEPARGDLVQQPVVDLGGGHGLGLRGHALAQ